MRIVSKVLILSYCLATAACSGGLVRGEPPLVGISTLELDGQAIHTRVNIYNPNSENMPVHMIEMSMILGEIDLGRHSRRLGISVHPNGTEEVGFDFPDNDAASRRLAELERGEVVSLAYLVEGKVSNAEGDSEKFNQAGYLYPVPGRPGQFRGAGPQRDQSRDRPRDPPRNQ